MVHSDLASHDKIVVSEGGILVPALHMFLACTASCSLLPFDSNLCLLSDEPIKKALEARTLLPRQRSVMHLQSLH